jgi:hypothetical protein
MSTRCQVQVVSQGRNIRTLYHHTDGYPSHMMPRLVAADEKFHAEQYWQYTSIHKVENYLVAEDPSAYEIEPGHELHGDIEWLYRIDVSDLEHWTITVWSRDRDRPTDLDETHMAMLRGVSLAEAQELLSANDRLAEASRADD